MGLVIMFHNKDGIAEEWDRVEVVL